MFELKATIQGKDRLSQITKLENLDFALKQKFGSAIHDVSAWGEEHARHPGEVLISVLFQHRYPNDIRKFVCALRHEVISIQNLVTEAYFPINREGRRRPNNKNRTAQ